MTLSDKIDQGEWLKIEGAAQALCDSSWDHAGQIGEVLVAALSQGLNAEACMQAVDAIKGISAEERAQVQAVADASQSFGADTVAGAFGEQLRRRFAGYAIYHERFNPSGRKKNPDGQFDTGALDL